MKTFNMRSLIGCNSGNSEFAVKFLYSDVIPALDKGENIEFDFAGVRLITCSFGNALFANLLRAKGADVIKRIRITNSNRLVSSEIRWGIALGEKHLRETGSAA